MIEEDQELGGQVRMTSSLPTCSTGRLFSTPAKTVVEDLEKSCRLCETPIPVRLFRLPFNQRMARPSDSNAFFYIEQNWLVFRTKGRCDRGRIARRSCVAYSNLGSVSAQRGDLCENSR